MSPIWQFRCIPKMRKLMHRATFCGPFIGCPDCPKMKRDFLSTFLWLDIRANNFVIFMFIWICQLAKFKPNGYFLKGRIITLFSLSIRAQLALFHFTVSARLNGWCKKAHSWLNTAVKIEGLFQRRLLHLY